MTPRLYTIGYESATVERFLEALRAAGVQVVVDVRAIAASRRPGFAKTRLAESLRSAGIEYLHLRGLGTPAEGRAAARAGKHDELRRIYLEHLATGPARDDLDELARLVAADRSVCLLCLEADPEHCHRSLVAETVRARLDIEVTHLHPAPV
jgi:uncharacterized protein (DUF488 family)